MVFHSKLSFSVPCCALIICTNEVVMIFDGRMMFLLSLCTIGRFLLLSYGSEMHTFLPVESAALSHIINMFF